MSEDFVFQAGEPIGGIPGAPTVQNVWYDTFEGETVDTRGIEIIGDYLYFEPELEIIEVYDVSDPSNPEYIKTLDHVIAEHSLRAMKATKDEEHLLVCDGSGWVRVFDIADPLNPVETWSIEMTSTPASGGMDGIIAVNDVIVASNYDGLYTFDFTDPSNVTFGEWIPSNAVGYSGTWYADGDHIYHFIDHYWMGCGSQIDTYYVETPEITFDLGHQYPPPIYMAMGGNSFNALNENTGLIAANMYIGQGETVFVQVDI